MRCITTFTLAISLLMAHLHSIEVQGHRGARNAFPENTLPAFQGAWEAGADLIELDVQVTSDKALIVHHNFALNSNISCYLDGSSIKKPELVRDLSLSDIKKIDCGSKTDSQFPDQKSLPGTRIPTLEELFNAITSSSHPNAEKIRINIEIKRDPRVPEQSYPATEIVDLVLAEVKKKGFASRVQYSSFDPEVLIALREKAPRAIISCLFNEEILKEICKRYSQAGMDFIMAFASTLEAQILSPHHTILKHASQVRAMQKDGFKVVAWTVNDPIRWKELYDMGIDGIITDYPQALVNFLAEVKQKQLEEEARARALKEEPFIEILPEDLSTGTDLSSNN